MRKFFSPMFLHVGRQVGFFHQIQRRFRPPRRLIQITDAVFVMFRQFHVGVDVTLLRGLLPQADSFAEVAAPLLQMGQPLQRRPEICFR